jgi:ABC-type lipoprotein export system ATPase subunit
MILSFLDISKMQTSSFPDVLLLDEILDGAIDSITLTQMFNIIAKKQKEDNLKLFIVSHRKEINEIGKIDNIYKIEMQDGFSKISQTES